MVLCEVLDASNFFFTWAFIAVLGAASVLSLSGGAFKLFYTNVSYETWRWKTNPKFPPIETVKLELQKTLSGVVVATFCPALCLYLAKHGYSKAYCGITPEHDIKATVIQFFVVWLVSDFYEFFYHWCGHKFSFLWEQHKSHHQFFNPTPFAVIADDVFDQVFRALPMLVFPMIAPINLDLMFGTWGTLFYLYGTYIHLGYEFPLISAHHPILNGSYHHHLHHAISTKNKPMHTGFFFKLWDQLFDSVHKGECFCCECQHKQGKRTEKEFKAISIPDYSPLFTVDFWLTTPKTE